MNSWFVITMSHLKSHCIFPEYFCQRWCNKDSESNQYDKCHITAFKQSQIISYYTKIMYKLCKYYYYNINVIKQ